MPSPSLQTPQSAAAATTTTLLTTPTAHAATTAAPTVEVVDVALLPASLPAAAWPAAGDFGLSDHRPVTVHFNVTMHDHQGKEAAAAAAAGTAAAGAGGW